jgi:hypothetical protein
MPSALATIRGTTLPDPSAEVLATHMDRWLCCTSIVAETDTGLRCPDGRGLRPHKGEHNKKRVLVLAAGGSPGKGAGERRQFTEDKALPAVIRERGFALFGFRLEKCSSASKLQ